VGDGWPDCCGHGNVQLKTTLGKVINGEALSVSAHVVAWHAFQSASLAGSREMCVLDHRSHRERSKDHENKHLFNSYICPVSI